MAFNRQGKALKAKPKADLTNDEIDYIISKLRNATYQGKEFETFYKVISKLQNLLK
jgi:hypothetical protein